MCYPFISLKATIGWRFLKGVLPGCYGVIILSLTGCLKSGRLSSDTIAYSHVKREIFSRCVSTIRFSQSAKLVGAGQRPLQQIADHIGHLCHL